MTFNAEVSGVSRRQQTGWGRTLRRAAQVSPCWEMLQVIPSYQNWQSMLRRQLLPAS